MCHPGGPALRAKVLATKHIFIFCIVFTSSGQQSVLPKTSKLFSMFEKVAIVLAKATIIGGTLLDNYIRSLLSVSFLIEFIERQTGLDDIVYIPGEVRELLGIVMFCGGTLYSSRRNSQEEWRYHILGAAKLPQAVGFFSGKKRGRASRRFTLLGGSLGICKYCLAPQVIAGGAWNFRGMQVDQLTRSSAHDFDHTGERSLMANKNLMVQRLRLAAAN